MLIFSHAEVPTLPERPCWGCVRWTDALDCLYDAMALLSQAVSCSVLWMVSIKQTWIRFCPCQHKCVRFHRSAAFL